MDVNSAPKQQKIYIGELRKDLKIFPGNKNDFGEKTWVIFDPAADKYFRISEKEYSIIIFFDKNLSFEDLLEKVKIVNVQIKKEDVLAVISFLSNNNLLLSSYLVTENRLNQVRQFRSKILATKLMSSYLFFRIPLWSPDNFLTKTVDLVRAVFNKWLLLFLLIISICGYISVVVHWNKFAAAIIGSLNYSGLIKYGITIIILKVFHEFGHAYSAKVAGVRVRRFGIGFIVFFPRFFTDITDSWRIKKRSQRMLIDSAGILVELLIGGLAALMWLNTGPGTINTIAYYIFAVSIINTVLVNGNPFIRYDGYYLLMDIVNIDNLQRQGSVEIQYLIRKYLFGIKEKILHNVVGWKKYFAVIYGVSSFIYRIFLYTGIILIIYFKFTKAVGIFLVCLEIYVLVIKPFISEMKFIIMRKNKIKSKNFIISFSVFVLILIVLFAPMPWLITIPCVVDSADRKIVYVNQDGLLQKFLVNNYQAVKKGEKLFLQSNPILKFADAELKVRLDSLKAELDQQRAVFSGAASDKIKIQQIINTENDLKENIRKIQQLTVLSPITGIFVLFDWHLKAGKWLNKGEPIGEVFSTKQIVISAYATESNVDKLNVNDSVTIYLQNELKKFKGIILSINPVPLKLWGPSPLLSTAGGPLEVIRKADNYTYLLNEYYYQVVIKPDKEYKNLKYSRTGNVEVRKYSSIGLNFFRRVLKMVQSELTF